MKKIKSSWRDLYIHLLNEGPRPAESLSDEELQLQRKLVSELIDGRYAKGVVCRTPNFEAGESIWQGPTTAGRLFADQLADEKKKEGWMHRLKFAAVALFAWLAGIASDVIVELSSK